MTKLGKWLRWQRRWFPARCDGAWRLPADRGQFHVFLLAGQSNMAGHGCLREDDPWQPGDFEPVPGVVVLGGQASPKSPRPWGRICWRPAAHPLHLNQSSSAFGLGLEFARIYQELRPGVTVGLVPCAWGGAAIDRFGEGCPLRDNAVRRGKLAASRGTLQGVLWHQGESDTMDDESARCHEGKLRNLIRGLRAELECDDLFFAIGDFSPALAAAKEGSDPAWAARIAGVRGGLRRVAEEDPHAAWVASDGLPGVSRDVFHFDRAALVEMGRRYARAVVAGLARESPDSSPTFRAVECVGSDRWQRC